MDWNAEIRRQVETHWTTQLRPRLEGLTDPEYFWEPVPDSWTVRRDGDRFTADFAVPPPEPAPVTTIAWRLGHLVVVLSGMRAMPPFGGEPVDFATFPYAGTAAEALAQLDAAYSAWMGDVERLGVDGLTADTATEGWPVVAIVLHVQRELLHHGAEIALLRDLYRGR
ncbi:DinB family protein [Kribbella sp. NPDC051770]|uniref:DinB family protein n=1 Tax=Kribbella sp. NPDC051770 TaxID=3155413 RepID=UPI003414E5FE